MLYLHEFICSIGVFVEATGLKSQELELQAAGSHLMLVLGARSSARAMRELLIIEQFHLPKAIFKVSLKCLHLSYVSKSRVFENLEKVSIKNGSSLQYLQFSEKKLLHKDKRRSLLLKI